MSERFPPFPAFPNGWFTVAWSDELTAGQVEPLVYFGRQLVLFRDEEGSARVLDAHCPHLGAHLGIGGKVEGTGIRCPFHAWHWDGKGHCLDIPYAKRIPQKARIHSWPVLDRNGLVMVWHHAEGAPPEEEIAEIPEVASQSWTPFTKLEWTVHSRMYDMGENAVDHVHFQFLHGASSPSSMEQSVDERGRVRSLSKMNMTTPRGPTPGEIESLSLGPGMGLVWVRGIADTLIITNSTPVDEETVHVRFSYSQLAASEPHRQRVAAALLADLKKQMEQDIVVFEHKRHWKQPHLLPEDGPIGEYRRRARASYSHEGPFYGDGE